MRSKMALLLSQLGLLCLIYTVLRALFLFFNFQSYEHATAVEMVQAFTTGLRVDIAAICWTNGVFILLSMLPFAFVDTRGYQRFLKGVFLISNVPFLILNIADLEYHKFTGQRATLSLLDMANDVPTQIGQLLYHYWYLTALGVLIIVALYRLFPTRKSACADAPHQRWPWAGEIVALIVAASLTFLGARGGWQPYPLTPGRVEVAGQESLSQLALNSTHTMIRSSHKCDGASRVQYFATDEELNKQFPEKHLAGRPLNHPPDNIVIILVESLSSEYTGIGHSGRSYTPFLNSLAKRSIYFNNSFADGRRSIDAPPAVLAGLEHLRDETFYCAEFKDLRGIGATLKKAGYDTSFFHGGGNGTMHFDTFSRRMGFDHYYGRNEYPKPQDATSTWGIDDEPYFQYVAQELSRRPQPFASILFTLSMHNPYIMPPGHEGMFPKGELPILEIVGYTDLALRGFFGTAEKMPWFKNTLFVITGDHIGPRKVIAPHMIDNYRVPIIFFHPGRKLPNVNAEKVVQHVDIPSSVLDYVGVATDDTLPFGHSIFDQTYEGLAVGQQGGNYWIADKNYYLEYRIGGPGKLFALARLDGPALTNAEAETRLEKKLKAHIQWFTNGLAENHLYH